MMLTAAQTSLFALAWAALTFALWRRRRWLAFYVTGALGFVLLVLFASQLFGWDSRLEAIQAREVAAIAQALGIDLSVLSGTGLAVKNHVGWAVFDVGVECSALLEMAAFAGLIGFYPGFTLLRRGITIVVGLVLTYALNIARILLIVAIINAGGTSWVFTAHAVFGRVLFFAGVVGIFWYLVTRPTMRIVSGQLEAMPE
ncbi:MAG: hypothetical protein Kow0056_08600 [Coriobacteriia bacterium]